MPDTIQLGPEMVFQTLVVVHNFLALAEDRMGRGVEEDRIHLVDSVGTTLSKVMREDYGSVYAA